MKKYLVVFAALALVFAGCKDPNNNPTSEYTKIAFKDASVTLSPGQQAKLALVWEPTSLDAPVCEWSTSDANVATVKNGVVTAVASGEAKITAKLGELTAVCNVTVASIFDMLTWNDFKVAYDENDPTTAIGEPYDVVASNGTTYKVQLFQCTYYLYDENIDYVSGTGFTGAGFMSFIDAPIEVIVEGEYAGYYWTNELVFEDLATDSAGVVPTGALTNVNEWAAYLFDSTYVGDGSFKGAAIHYLDWDNDDEVDFVGFIKNGWLGTYSNGTFYQMNVTWMGGYLGLEVNEEGTAFVEPYTFAERTEQYFELLPSQELAKKPISLNKKANIRKSIKVRDIKDAKVLMHK